MWSASLLLGSIVLAAGQGDDIEEVSLLQTVFRGYPGSAAAGQNWSNHVMSQMAGFWTTGVWATRPLQPTPDCGKSTFQELQIPIPKWREQHPEEDGFCYFENHAMWFQGAGMANVDGGYRAYGKTYGLHGGALTQTCDSVGEDLGAGPELSFNYDGIEISWLHMRNCIDIVDDPYCYSLGWLKGQGGWDESVMDNSSAWEQLAREQCDKLQAEFHFDDEEVTVGKHVFNTPLYFKRTWNSLQGTGTPIDKRLHAEHVYTKCQLGRGGAPIEMAYCYFKGCVLPGNKIGHLDECNYDP